MTSGDAGRIVAFALRRHCPCCDAPSRTSVPIAGSEPAAESLPLDAHGPFLSGFASGRVFFTYHRCLDCGAVYCPVHYTEEQLERLYAGLPENMADAPLAARRRTQEQYAAILMRHSRARGSFLELGSDIGLFAGAMAAKGRFDHFWLYEPNRQVHAQIEANLPEGACTIRSGRYHPSDVPSGTVSTAALVHVLDHLLDPGQALRDVAEALEPNGVVLVVTHNVASVLARSLGRRWPPFTLQHPQLFSPGSLKRLLDQSGYEVAEVALTRNYLPALYLVSAGLTTLGRSRPLRWARFGPLLPVRLGNMAMVARKVR